MSTPAADGKSKKFVQDARFQHVHTDPRFQRTAKNERKFQPDSRFQKMFTDQSFKTNYKVDQWGRKIETGQADELLKYYEMDEETKKAVTNGDKKKGKQTPAKKAAPAKAEDDEAPAAASKSSKKSSSAAAPKSSSKKPTKSAPVEDEEDDEDAAPDEEGFDGNFMSDRGMAPPSSDEDGEDDDEEVEEDEEDENGDAAAAAEPDSTDEDDDESDVEMEVATEEEVIPTAEEGTISARRLAVMNLEWDRLSSVDLLVLFRSFVTQPAGSLTHPVKSVTVYPSEFGRARMKEEAMYGPTNIYAGNMSAEDYRKKIEQKMKQAAVPVLDDEDEDEATKEEDESERSDESDAEDDSTPKKKKRVSFPTGTKNSKKSKTPLQPTPTPAKPTQKNKKKLSEEEEAMKEATDDILAQPASSTAEEDDSGSDSDSEKSSDAGAEFDAEKLRAYELERLKYYYAIVECDTPATAEQLYKGCDGQEFEHSSNVIDLRYVPDEVSFEEEEQYIRDSCSKVPANYKAPSDFYTGSLQHTNVQLTWDRDDPTRTKLLSKKFKPGTEDEAADDLKAYLGSDDEEDGYGSDAVTEASDSESEEEASDSENGTKSKGKKKVVLKRKARAKYLALLQELKKPLADGEEGDEETHEVSITFEPGLKAKGEEIAKKALNKANEKEESTWEKHLRERLEKKKAKKKARKEKLKGLEAGENGAAASGAAGDEEDSGDEIGGANARMQSDLYEDDEVEYDPNDTFFQLSDDDLEPEPAGKKGKKTIESESDDDDDSAISMSSESGEEGGAGDDDDESMDEDNIDSYHGKEKSRRFFDDSTPAPKAKKAATATAPTDKKRKRPTDEDEDEIGDDDKDTEDAATRAAREKGELELLMIDEDDSNETGQRGYSLKTLLKQKKSALQAESGGKKSRQHKKSKTDATTAAVDDFKVDTQDPRFHALFQNAAFSIDPTHPSFKSTEGTEQLLHEKARRRQEQEKEQAQELFKRKQAAKKTGGQNPTTTTDATAAAADSTAAPSTTTASLASLVASVKRKSQLAVSQSQKSSVKPLSQAKQPPSKRSKPETSNL